MKKTVLFNERQLNVIKESLEKETILSDKLRPFIFKQVKKHMTSLGDNEAFPPEEDLPFDYKILKDRFNEVIENLKKVESLESFDETYLSNRLSQLVKECKEIEEPIKPNLEKICTNVILQLFDVPNDTINFSVEIVDEIRPEHQFRIKPEPSAKRKFDFESLDDFKDANKAVLKRRLINSLIQGAAYTYANTKDYFLNDIYKIDKRLLDIYSEITAINDYLLFTKEEKITDKSPMQGGCVEVSLNGSKDKTTIKAQGIIFPFALAELIRGFFELFASHGLPKDDAKARYIINQADFLIAEPWDLRMGVNLWKYIESSLTDTKILPYFFVNLCSLPIEEFNTSLQEIFAQTLKGKHLLKHMFLNAENDMNSQGFVSTIDAKNAQIALIADDTISSDELTEMIKECLESSIQAPFYEAKTSKYDGLKASRTKLAQRINDMITSDDEEENAKIKNAANQAGVDLSSPQSNRGVQDDDLRIMELGLFNNTEQIKNEIIDAVRILKAVTNSNGAINPTFNQNYSEEEQTKVLRMKQFLDRQGLAFLYDASFLTDPLRNQFGFKYIKEKTSPSIEEIEKYLDLSKLNPSNASYNDNDFKPLKASKEKAKLFAKKAMLTRYLNSNYGVTLSIPSFSLGNSKVKNALIVNFASAYGCPAWNRCLLKHACYARDVERGVNGETVYSANQKRQFLWLSASYDLTLKKLLFSYIRNAVIDFSMIWNKIPSLQEKYESFDDFVETPFSLWDTEELELAKQIKKVSYIRFNENGDFLNEAVLDMADELAEDFANIDLLASAYTCRNLNFSKVKNIILNASQKGLNKDTTQGDDVFARMFYALPVDVYDKLPDTWEIVKDEKLGIKVLPKLIETTDSLNDDGTLNAIYKCPCEKKIGNNKINCEQCHFCYEPKQEGYDKIFVIVNVHGNSLKRYDRKPIPQIVKQLGYGIGENKDEFNQAIALINNEVNQTNIQKEDLNRELNQSIVDNSNLAINTICNYAIKTMNDISQNIADSHNI